MNTPAEENLVGIALEAMQPGGAGVGVVDEVGEHSAALRGCRVLIGPTDPCGQCEVCRRGGAPVCPHARRREPGVTRLQAASRWLVTFGDSFDLPMPAAAAVPGDVALAYTIYARTGLGPREPVVITGTTAVTRFLVEILIAKNIAPVVVADDDDRAWRDWLVSKGAHVASTGGEVRAAVTTAVAAQGLGARPWRLLATDEVAVAASLAGPRATLTVLANRTIGALPAELLAREVTVIGVAGAHPDLVVEAAAMCVKGEIDLAGGVVIGPNGDRTRAVVIPVVRS
ncbi:MAG: Alcohol dehydrogenase GroES domain protein [Myxococcales bacterium]|nr:Alcohol dehydrogenase GroES domain protein [Myxococcales bacterium]